jgi:hypothetical protein
LRRIARGSADGGTGRPVPRISKRVGNGHDTTPSISVPLAERTAHGRVYFALASKNLEAGVSVWAHCGLLQRASTSKPFRPRADQAHGRRLRCPAVDADQGGILR